jgi:hypothetical protein
MNRWIRKNKEIKEEQFNDQKDELSEPKDALPPITIDKLPEVM